MSKWVKKGLVIKPENHKDEKNYVFLIIVLKYSKRPKCSYPNNNPHGKPRSH